MIAGSAATMLAVAVCQRHLAPSDVFPGGRGPEGVGAAAALIGAFALVVAGGVTRWLAGAKWSLKAAAGTVALWIGLFVVSAAVWLAIDAGSRRTVLGLFQNEAFASREPVSVWLDVLSQPPNHPSARRNALFSLGEIGIADPRCLSAIVAALADQDNRVAETAAYEVEKNTFQGAEVTAALGRALVAPIPKAKDSLCGALDNQSAADLRTVAPISLRRLPVVEETARSRSFTF